jgi:hypothetical protein
MRSVTLCSLRFYALCLLRLHQPLLDHSYARQQLPHALLPRVHTAQPGGGQRTQAQRAKQVHKLYNIGSHAAQRGGGVTPLQLLVPHVYESGVGRMGEGGHGGV